MAAFTGFDDHGDRGFGWGKPSAGAWTGRVFSRSAFGHTGFTGTVIWIDPEKQLFIVLLSNRIHPSRDNHKFFDEAVESIAGAVMRALPADAGQTEH